MKWLALALALLAPPLSWAACDNATTRADCARLTWTYPAQNVDGSTLIDLASFTVYRRCGAEVAVPIAAPIATTAAPTGTEAQTWDDEAPALGSTCWYSMTASNLAGEESARTGEVSKAFAAVEVRPAAPANVTLALLDEPGPPNVTISHVQSGGTNTDSAQPGARTTAGNVTSGNLVVIVASRYSPSSDTFVAGDCTKTAGTSTIGTVSLDAQITLDTGGGIYALVGIWSAIVTGTGSLTMSVAGSSTDYWNVSVMEFSATTGWDASRLDGTAVTNSTAANNSSPATSGNKSSTGGGVFVAGVGISGGSSITITEDAAYSLTFEEGNGAAHNIGSHIYQIVTGATTDNASWTISNPQDGWVAAQVVYKEVGGGLGATVNQATETDTAQAIAKSKAKAIGLVSESDVAQAVARVKSRALGQASETDTAQAAVGSKAKAIAQALETDLAQAVTRGGVAYPLAQAAETDTAQAATSAKAKALVQAAELDLAQAITHAGINLAGQAFETDAAQAMARSKAKAIGQAAELGLAQTIARIKTGTLGQAAESELAQTITRLGVNMVTQVVESSLAQAIGRAKAKAIGQSLETDAAIAMSAVRAYALGQASEADAAIAVAAIGKAKALGLVTERDLALDFGVIGGAPADVFYLAEALEMAAAAIIAALANTTITVDYTGAGQQSGVVAIHQKRSFDPATGIRMFASTETEFLIEKLTAPAALVPDSLILDEVSGSVYSVRRVDYNRGGIITIAVQRT